MKNETVKLDLGSKNADKSICQSCEKDADRIVWCTRKNCPIIRRRRLTK